MYCFKTCLYLNYNIIYSFPTEIDNVLKVTHIPKTGRFTATVQIRGDKWNKRLTVNTDVGIY